MIILLAAAPAIGLSIYANSRQYDEAYENAGQNLLDMAALAASNETRAVQGVHDLLTAIGNAPVVAAGDWAACNAYLSNLNGRYEFYDTFAIIGTDGDLACTSDPRMPKMDISDRPFFQTAMQEQRFVTAGYVINRFSGVPVAAFALPVVTDGKVIGVVTTALRLEAFTSLVRQIAIPKNAFVSVVDSQGIVLVAEPHRESMIGKPLASAALRANLVPHNSSLVEADGPDGVRRLFAIAPASHEGRPIFYIIIGLDKRTLAAPAKTALMANLVILTLVVIVSLSGTWAAGKRLLVIPVKQLVGTAKRVAKGDLRARTNISHTEGELGELAYHFDEMASALEKREEETRAANQYIEHQACHDPLTKLPNRTFLLERLAQCLTEARQSGKLVGVLYVDLDRFKIINHSLGHVIGDRLLSAVADRLRNCLSTECMVARVGGNEFVCVVPDMSRSADASQAARAVLECLAKPYATESGPVSIGARIGISIGPVENEDASTLLEYAEVAVYRAKENDDKVQFFVKEMNAFAVRRLTLENELRTALEKQQFVLYYQPQVSLENGRIIGMEALVRWQHPQRGLVSPATFIALAEETRLIVAIGEWTLRTACMQNKAWQAAGLPARPVSVNISAHQITSPGFIDTVTRALRDSEQPPRLLELEVTEGVLLNDLTGTLKQLRKIGISLSIDDFGTGYSSLSYLKNLPFNKLKIDQSFIKNITKSPYDEAITKAIITIAKSLDLKVVAEGVENIETYRYLQSAGCDAVQGYYNSKPLDAAAFKVLLEKDRLAPHIALDIPADR
jgi:diguanylate cyclase (GGDEF)-like protein